MAPAGAKQIAAFFSPFHEPLNKKKKGKKKKEKKKSKFGLSSRSIFLVDLTPRTPEGKLYIGSVCCVIRSRSIEAHPGLDFLKTAGTRIQPAVTQG